MTRITLAAFAAIALGGCRYQGEQAVDPFWGRQTVAPPATGSVGTAVVYPGYPPTAAGPQPVVPGTTYPGGAIPSTTSPNFLPGPMTSPGGAAAPARPTISAVPSPAGGAPLALGQARPRRRRPRRPWYRRRLLHRRRDTRTASPHPLPLPREARGDARSQPRRRHPRLVPGRRPQAVDRLLTGMDHCPTGMEHRRLPVRHRQILLLRFRRASSSPAGSSGGLSFGSSATTPAASNAPSGPAPSASLAPLGASPSGSPGYFPSDGSMKYGGGP